MPLALPENIAAITRPTKGDVPALDAWAKSLDPNITVTFSEHRAAPPRKPGRGESIEEARARDPGPPCLQVTAISKRDGGRRYWRVHLHTRGTASSQITGLAARTEHAVYQAEQNKLLKGHVLSDAVLLSGVSDELLASGDEAAIHSARAAVWDYPDQTAKHHDMMGVLCPESVANPTYVANEAHMHDLRQTAEADWKAELARVMESALYVATVAEGSGHNQTVQIKGAVDRARAARAGRTR